MQDTEPKGLIPLDSCQVRSTKVLDEFYCFELFDPSSRIVKSLKLGKKGSVLGAHQTFIFACKDEKEQESWIQLISGNLISNPVQQLINAKKLRMEKQKPKDLAEQIGEPQTENMNSSEPTQKLEEEL